MRNAPCINILQHKKQDGVSLRFIDRRVTLVCVVDSNSVSSKIKQLNSSCTEMAVHFALDDLIADEWRVIRIHDSVDEFSGRYIVKHRVTEKVAMCEVEHQLAFVSLLPRNAKIIKELNDNGAFCFPEFIKYDEYLPGGYRYLITSPIGPSLWHLQRLLPENAGRRFSLFTCLHIGRMSLSSLQELHEAGYLHRDVKAEVFSLRSSFPVSNLLLLTLDFPRRWLDFDGCTPLPSRSAAPFRGNLKYASVNALRQREQTRFDDIWSWFYLLVHLTTRSLPWLPLAPDGDIYETIKALADTKQLAHENVEWLQSAPGEYTEILAYLKSSSATDAPDYDRLDKLLSKVVDRVKEGTDGEMKLDWEIGGKYYDNLRQVL